VLRAQDLDKRNPALILRGRVLDEEREPIENAIVEPFGMALKNGIRFGGLTGFDPLALSNAEGEFRLAVPEAGVAVYLKVSAPAYAPRNFSAVPSGPKPADLTLFTGVTVTGRVLNDGKPLAGVAMGIAQQSHNVETFLGHFDAATDQNGVFRILNVPPHDTFALYGEMESLRAHGALSVRQVMVGKSGSTENMGDLEVTAGLRLSGRVVLADGKAVPAGTRAVISRTEAWDAQQALVDKEGGFAFTGLPPEAYSLPVTVPGYHLSPKNFSTDLLNGFSLLGVVHQNIEGLRLLLEPGDPQVPAPQKRDQSFFAEHNRRRNAPLRGIEQETDPVKKRGSPDE
jgi:hypothetical protein